MIWFYISFVDVPTEKFIGACVVQAASDSEALNEARARGCNPGGQAAVVPVESMWGDPPEEIQNVLFKTKEEIQEKFASWLGEEGAKPETIKEKRERGIRVGATIVCSACNMGTPHTHD